MTSKRHILIKFKHRIEQINAVLSLEHGTDHNTNIVIELYTEGLDTNTIQTILKHRGVDWSLEDIEQICSKPHNLMPKREVSKLIDDIMESMRPLWEKYTIYDECAPKCALLINLTRDKYLMFYRQINKDDLDAIDLLGYEALEFLRTINSRELISEHLGEEVYDSSNKSMKKFWKPFYATWFHVKYPEFIRLFKIMQIIN